MGSIVETMAGDKRLKLGNEQFVRKLAVGRNWHHLRIGVRLGFDCAASSVTSPHLAIGLCSGTSNCVGDASTTNWYGLTSRTCGSATITGSTIKSHYFYPFQAQKRVGTTWTDFGYLSMAYITSAPSSRRCLIFFDLIDTPTPTMKMYANQNATFGIGDITLDNFLTLLSNISPPQDSYVTGSRTFTLSETAGSLDTVNIMWNNDSYKMEFSDIAVYRFS